MALVYMDGFDMYASVANLSRRWETILSSQFSLTAGRSGGQCLRCTNGLASANVARKTFSALTTVIVGFALRVSTAPGATIQVAALIEDGLTGTTQVGIGMDTSRHLLLYRGTTATVLATGTTVLAINTWYYVELKLTINATTGTYDLYINGTSELTGTGANTKGGTGTTASVLSLAGMGSAITTDWDDLYIADTTGSFNNAVLGPVQIDVYAPTSDSAQKDFTRSTGSTNFSLVDEIVSNDDTDYVSSPTSGNKDLYNITGLTVEPTTIFAVQVNAQMKKTDSGSRSARLNLKSGGTTYNGSTAVLGSSYTCVTALWEKNPNGTVTWTGSTVNAIQIGPEVV